MSDTRTSSGESSGSGLAEGRTRFASQLAAAVVRRIEVPRIVSASGKASSIRIGEINLGDANVDQIDVADVETRFSTGNTLLREVRAIIEIRITLKWWYDFKLKSGGGEESLPSPEFTFPLGDVSVPALNDIRLEVPSATVDDVRATLQPVTNLDLGGGTFEDLRLADTLVPSAGFGLGGLGLGAVALKDLGSPAVSAGSLEVGSFAPTRPLVLPSLRVDGVELPAASAAEAESGAIHVPEATSSKAIKKIEFDKKVVGFDLLIEPVLEMFIQRMVIKDLTASASVGRLQVQNVSAPVELSDVSLDGLELERLAIDRITV